MRSLIAAMLLALAAPAMGQPEAGREALADRYIALSGIDDLMRTTQRLVDVEAMLAAMGEQAQAIERARPGFTARLTAMVERETRTMMEAMMPRVMASTRGFLLEHFGEDELAQMVRYMESPVGRKAVALMPGLVEGQQAVLQQELARLLPGVNARMQSFLRAELAAPPAVRS